MRNNQQEQGLQGGGGGPRAGVGEKEEHEKAKMGATLTGTSKPTGAINPLICARPAGALHILIPKPVPPVIPHDVINEALD